jgi:hypothetical protein
MGSFHAVIARSRALCLGTMLVACGGSDDVAGSDAAADGTVATPDTGATADGTSDAPTPPPDAIAPAPDASLDAPSDGGAGGDASDADAGIPCTPATVGIDCPPMACPLALSGCVAGYCQYKPINGCPARSFTGSFVSGGVDREAGTSVLIGNIGELRAGYGPTCNATTCLTGGITP